MYHESGCVGFCSEPKGPRQKGRTYVTLLWIYGLFGLFGAQLKGSFCCARMLLNLGYPKEMKVRAKHCKNEKNETGRREADHDYCL